VVNLVDQHHLLEDRDGLSAVLSLRNDYLAVLHLFQQDLQHEEVVAIVVDDQHSLMLNPLPVSEGIDWGLGLPLDGIFQLLKGSIDRIIRVKVVLLGQSAQLSQVLIGQPHFGHLSILRTCLSLNEVVLRLLNPEKQAWLEVQLLHELLHVARHVRIERVCQIVNADGLHGGSTRSLLHLDAALELTDNCQLLRRSHPTSHRTLPL